MKLFVLSIGITLLLMLGYALVATMLVLALSPDLSNLDKSAIALVDIPFRAPKYIYYYFFPPTAADFSTNPADIGGKKALLAAVFFVVNVLLYSFPVYLLLRLIARLRRRGRGGETSELPPSPPRF